MLTFLGKDLINNLYEIRVAGGYICFDCKTDFTKTVYILNLSGLSCCTDFKRLGPQSHIRLDHISQENQEILNHVVLDLTSSAKKMLVVPKGTFEQILKTCIPGF